MLGIPIPGDLDFVGVPEVVLDDLSRRRWCVVAPEASSPEDRRRIVDAIESAPTFRRLIHLRTQHLGPDQLLVGAKVEFDESLGFSGVIAAINDVERAIRESVPIATVIYLEPDRYQSDRTAGAESVEE